MISWKRTLRTASSERFLAQREGKDVAAVDLPANFPAVGQSIRADRPFQLFPHPPPPVTRNPLQRLRRLRHSAMTNFLLRFFMRLR